MDFVAFWDYILASIAQFLMTEPVVYITGLILLGFVISLVKRICNI